jgi:hypothetical protein
MRRILITGLLSSLALTATAATGKSANDAAASNTTPVRPISTGVKSPQLLSDARIEIPASAISEAFPNPAQVVLTFNLDANGKANNIQVVQPITQDVDARVISAVQQFHWRPATLDHQAIPVDMKLIVQVQR